MGVYGETGHQDARRMITQGRPTEQSRWACELMAASRSISNLTRSVTVPGTGYPGHYAAHSAHEPSPVAAAQCVLLPLTTMGIPGTSDRGLVSSSSGLLIE